MLKYYLGLVTLPTQGQGCALPRWGGAKGVDSPPWPRSRETSADGALRAARERRALKHIPKASEESVGGDGAQPVGTEIGGATIRFVCDARAPIWAHNISLSGDRSTLQEVDVTCSPGHEQEFQEQEIPGRSLGSLDSFSLPAGGRDFLKPALCSPRQKQ